MTNLNKLLSKACEAMEVKYYFLIVIFISSGSVMSMPRLSLVEELVSQSELIVIGKLTIISTRDGHIGSIEIEKRLWGDDVHPSLSIRFISTPVDLVQNQSRIWFLRREGNPVNAESLWRVQVVEGDSSLAKEDESAVLNNIVKSDHQRFAEYIGLSEAEVISKLGEPAHKTSERWTYQQPPGRGMHSFRTEREFVFKDGKVIQIINHKVAIGCTVVESCESNR